MFSGALGERILLEDAHLRSLRGTRMAMVAAKAHLSPPGGER